MTEINEMNLYKVLARKYRPETFKDLVGQAAMVQTLQNAFEADRIAQAFILTGIRGTGKTTTARIIAKGLNCIGLDQNGGPTTGVSAPTGGCWTGTGSNPRIASPKLPETCSVHKLELDFAQS